MIKEKQLDVLVIVPSMTTWHAEFAMSLIGLMGYFQNTQVPGCYSQSIRVVNKRGSILPNLRVAGLRDAIAIDATHILWLDSDHTFPPDLLNKLLSHSKDVVAANCAVKTLPSMPTARAFDPKDPKGQPVYTDWNSKGLERVWRIGTGIMLMSKRAYTQIPFNAFAMTYVEETGTYRGEDWGICEALEKEGCPIYIDHSISNECAHIGNFQFTHDHVGHFLPADGEEEGA